METTDVDFYDYHNDCGDDCYGYDECDMDDTDDYIDYCHECGGYGHDWSIDENGELVSNCDGCPFNERQKKGETK